MEDEEMRLLSVKLFYGMSIMRGAEVRSIDTGPNAMFVFMSGYEVDLQGIFQQICDTHIR